MQTSGFLKCIILEKGRPFATASLFFDSISVVACTYFSSSGGDGHYELMSFGYLL